MLKKFVRKVLAVLLVILGIYFCVLYMNSKSILHSPFGKSVYYSSESRDKTAQKPASWLTIDNWLSIPRNNSYEINPMKLEKSLIINETSKQDGKGERLEPEKKIVEDKKVEKSKVELEETEVSPLKPEVDVKKPTSQEVDIEGDVSESESKEMKHVEPKPKVELPKSEINVVAPKPEAPKSEPPKSEAPKSEPPKSEAPKSEPPKSEPPKPEAPKPEAPKPEAEGKKTETQNKDPPKSPSKGITWSKTPYNETQTFKVVDGVSLYVFSAFWDMDNNVRIFGIFQRVDYNPKLTCELWVSNPPSKDEVPLRGVVKLVVMPEHHSKKYTSGYVLCRLPQQSYKMSPVLATLSLEKDGKFTHTPLPIHQKEKWSSEFTVCVAPFFGSYNRAGVLLEMIEFNRLLGATRFVFYNYSIGPLVKEVLEHYRQKGIVDIVNWPLPAAALATKNGNDLDIHYFGQLSAMNDCVYRNRNQSNYVVLTDLDEFILPNITANLATWRDLVREQKKLNPKFTVFWIRNKFFRLEWSKPEHQVLFEIPEKKKYKSVLMSNRYRESGSFHHGDRSKNIVDPLGVRIVGIHNIWEKGGPRSLVPESQAVVAHYRSRYYPKDKQPRIYDDVVLRRFGYDIKRGVLKNWAEIFDNRQKQR